MILQEDRTLKIYLFLLFYIFVWGVLPSIFYQSIFMDSAENIGLSHSFSWTYYKHPPVGMIL